MLLLPNNARCLGRCGREKGWFLPQFWPKPLPNAACPQEPWLGFLCSPAALHSKQQPPVLHLFHRRLQEPIPALQRVCKVVLTGFSFSLISRGPVMTVLCAGQHVCKQSVKTLWYFRVTGHCKYTLTAATKAADLSTAGKRSPSWQAVLATEACLCCSSGLAATVCLRSDV